MMRYKGNCFLSTVRQEFYIHICTFGAETAHMVIVHSDKIKGILGKSWPHMFLVKNN